MIKNFEVGMIVRIKEWVQPEPEPYAVDFNECRDNRALGKVTHIDPLPGKSITCDFPINQEWRFDPSELYIIDTSELAENFVQPASVESDELASRRRCMEEINDLMYAAMGNPGTLKFNQTSMADDVRQLIQQRDQTLTRNRLLEDITRQMGNQLAAFAADVIDVDTLRRRLNDQIKRAVLQPAAVLVHRETPTLEYEEDHDDHPAADAATFYPFGKNGSD